ncbi:MAG: lipid-A-disaccharide synthase [Prosthecochloris sp.]|nr:lipid-A-disaccharide synthase [Prosthecochloris sp.]
MRERTLFVLAGEVSGDLHVSEVIEVVQTRCPALRVFGAGGRKLRALGADLLYDVDDLSVMGFVEVAGKGFFLRKVIRDLKRAIVARKPDAALLVDYPGMNLVLARYLHQHDIPVIYYISPKVWAWKESRIAKIKAYVDRLMVIFDFEVDFYKMHGVEAEFAGNPVVEEISRLEFRSKSDFLSDHHIQENRKIIGLLPGSRKQEIALVFPEMLRAAVMLQQKYDAVFLLGRAPHVNHRLYDSIAGRSGVELVDCSAYEAMHYSDLVLVTSGTATLEALCFGVPMIVLYKTGWLNYAIGKRLVRLHSFSLANLVAKGLDEKSQVVTELLQSAVTADRIYEESTVLLDDRNVSEAMRQHLLCAREKLGTVRPSEAVASAVCSYLNG